MAANLRFLRGTYANLQNQAIADGSIYITTDEPGLYVDYKAPNESEVKRHRVGDYRIFANLDALKAHYGSSKPSTTCLYYLSEQNILACYDGTNFKQINSQKTLDDLLGGFTSLGRVGTNGEIEIVHSIASDGGDSHSAQFSLESLDTDSLKITNDGTKVKFRAKDTTSSATLGTSGNKITLTSATTGTDAAGAAVNDSSSTSVSFAGEGLTVTTTTAGADATITIENKDTLTSTVQNGKLVVTLNRNGETSNTSSASFEPKVLYGKGSQSTAALGASSQFELDVYTSGQVDQLLNQKLTAVNAMVFRGNVGSQDDLPKLSDNPRIGDTYIVSQAAAFDAVVNGGTTPTSVSAMPGDLLIARGTESAGSATAEGYITSNLQWIYVPSADDTITLTAVENSGKVVITSQQGAADADTVVQFATDDMLSIAFSNKTATISHKKQATKPAGTKDNAAQDTVDTIAGIVTGLTFDDWGHITGYTYRDVEIHNTRVESIQQSIRTHVANMTAGASAAVLTTLTDTDSETMTSAFSVAADANSAIAIKTAAGDAASGPVVTIGMVWTDF